jgi:hypothetical protein
MTDRLIYTPTREGMTLGQFILSALTGLFSLTIIGTVAFGFWVMTP